MRKILLIGVVMAVLQQWCGINVIFNYAQEIFMAAGYGVSDVLMNIVVTGVTNVIFTVLAMCVVDRWGRKALTLFGAFGLTLIYAFMARPTGSISAESCCSSSWWPPIAATP